MAQIQKGAIRSHIWAALNVSNSSRWFSHWDLHWVREFPDDAMFDYQVTTEDMNTLPMLASQIPIRITFIQTSMAFETLLLMIGIGF